VKDSGQALKNALARFRRRSAPAPLRVMPTTPFEVAVEERLRNLEAHLQEVKGRINGLIFLLVGAVFVQLIVGFLK